MIELKVPHMNCEGCAKTISKELENKDIKFEISLATKTVKVDENDVKIAKKQIKKAGFKVE